jgi:hypothetical protein
MLLLIPAVLLLLCVLIHFSEEFRNVGINEVFAKPLDISQLENYYAKIRSEKSRKFSH